jgi:hypothetical protein
VRPERAARVDQRQRQNHSIVGGAEELVEQFIQGHRPGKRHSPVRETK